MPVDVEAAGIGVHLAARSGDVHVVRSLVQRPGTDMEARDILGDTALLKAARYGHTEVVELLLLAGADVNARDTNGWTSLHVSIANKREEVFFALLSCGAGQQSAPLNIEAANSSGDTLLHMAAYHGQDWAVETLLRLGADCRATNDKGESPFQVARHNTVRSMLKPSVTPRGKTVAASAADVAVGGVVRIPRDNDSEKTTTMRRPSIHQEKKSPSGGKSIDVKTGNDHTGFGPPGGEKLFSGAKPTGVDAARQGGELTNKRHLGGGIAPSSTSERSDGGAAAHGKGLDRLANGSLPSRLISTDALEEGVDSSDENLGDDLSFEEGSSEGELSLESEGGMP